MRLNSDSSVYVTCQSSRFCVCNSSPYWCDISIMFHYKQIKCQRVTLLITNKSSHNKSSLSVSRLCLFCLSASTLLIIKNVLFFRGVVYLFFFLFFLEEICTLVIAEAFPEDGGLFCCTASNLYGSVSSTAQLTVTPGASETDWTTLSAY